MTLTTGVGVPGATVGFVFRPDGASQVQSGSATGTRAIIWSGVTPWAVCRREHDCHWFGTGSAPRCLRAGARVQLAFVDTKPAAGGPGTQLLAWLKCLAV